MNFLYFFHGYYMVGFIRDKIEVRDVSELGAAGVHGKYGALVTTGRQRETLLA